MRPAVKTALLDALSSGKYKKTKHKLRTIDDKFCVNGVLCDLAAKDGVAMKVATYGDPTDPDKPRLGYSYDGMGAFPPMAVMDWAGIELSDEWRLNRLARVNDRNDGWEPVIEQVKELF